MRIRAREAPAIKSYTKTYRTCTQTSIIVNVTQLRRKIWYNKEQNPSMIIKSRVRVLANTDWKDALERSRLHSD